MISIALVGATTVAAGVIFLVLVAANPTSTTGVAATLLALERGALDRWGQGDPSGFLEISAPQVTYFDPFLRQRMNGLAALTAYYETIRGKIRIDRYEILDPHVEVAGDMAILSFNFVSWTDQAEQRWNCTEAYRRIGDAWRIVQTHWSLPSTASE